MYFKYKNDDSISASCDVTSGFYLFNQGVFFWGGGGNIYSSGAPLITICGFSCTNLHPSLTPRLSLKTMTCFHMPMVESVTVPNYCVVDLANKCERCYRGLPLDVSDWQLALPAMMDMFWFVCYLVVRLVVSSLGQVIEMFVAGFFFFCGYFCAFL